MIIVFYYELASLRMAQADDYYSGFTASINAVHGKMKLTLKLDISNNTLIYQGAVSNSFESMFDNECINIMSYPIENIIAEKYETTLDRGEFNTSMRDLFDIVLLLESDKQILNRELLAECIIEVFKERKTYSKLFNTEEIIDSLRNSSIFVKNFNKYKQQKYPILDLTLDEVFDKFKEIHTDVSDLIEKTV